MKKLLIALLIGTFFLLFFAGIGPGQLLSYGAMTVVWTIGSSSTAALYLVSAIGLGTLFDRLTTGTSDRWACRAGLGLSLQLTLTHLLGWSGLLFAGRLVAWVPMLLGIALLVFAILKDQRISPHASTGTGLGFLAIPALVLVLVAACNAPGWLWTSEFGGYDALSYHLELPQEWIALGRVTPVTHNVYSYLPSYFEAAFAHIAVADGARGPLNAGVGWGLLEGDGARTLTCQVLHALTSLLAAWLTGRLAFAIARKTMVAWRAALCAACAGAFFLATPWTIVVGSLAYNEMPMLALLVGAMLVAFESEISPARKGLLCGWLVGIACGVKPTALLMGGLPVGVVLLGTSQSRDWVRVALPGAIAGVLALAPWMVRNYGACGNPMFPFAAALFGNGHWTAEQIARHGAGHGFSGPLAQRLLLSLLPEMLEGGIKNYRGITHPQWAGFAVFLGVSIFAVFAKFAKRREFVLLCVAVVIQFLAWLFTTHVQSRFLLPLLVPGASLISLVIVSLAPQSAPDAANGRDRHWPARVFAGLPVVVQLVFSMATFAGERGGSPNATLLAGPGIFSGEALRAQYNETPESTREEFLADVPSEVFLNLYWPALASASGSAPSKVYLLGDATPFYLSVPTLYHTTWDTSPLGEAIREYRDNPTAWGAKLREQGVEFVLIDRSEVARLNRSGWYDPAVSPEVADRFVREACTLVKEWPKPDGSPSRGLYRLNPRNVPAPVPQSGGQPGAIP